MVLDVKNPHDRQRIKSLARLKFNDDFKVLVEYMEAELATMRRKNDLATGDMLKWTQGRCQMLQLLIDIPETAAKNLKSLQ